MKKKKYKKMGEFLSQPNKEKHSDDGENAFVSLKKTNLKNQQPFYNF